MIFGAAALPATIDLANLGSAGIISSARIANEPKRFLSEQRR